MVGLSLVKTDLSTPLHVRIQDPLNNERSVQYDQLHEAQLQGCFVVGKKRACAELAGLILPAVIVAAQRKISGQFATIRSGFSTYQLA
jgi:hypothetical protein